MVGMCLTCGRAGSLWQSVPPRRHPLFAQRIHHPCPEQVSAHRQRILASEHKPHDFIATDEATRLHQIFQPQLSKNGPKNTSNDSNFFFVTSKPSPQAARGRQHGGTSWRRPRAHRSLTVLPLQRSARNPCIKIAHRVGKAESRTTESTFVCQQNCIGALLSTRTRVSVLTSPRHTVQNTHRKSYSIDSFAERSRLWPFA